MGKKILYFSLITLGVVGLVALLWWWFAPRTQTSEPTSGSFGSAQTANRGGTAPQSPATNVPLSNGTPSIIGKTFNPGQYIFGSVDGKPLGTYAVSLGDTTGTYTVRPTGEQTAGTRYQPTVLETGTSGGTSTTPVGQIGVQNVTWLSDGTSTAQTTRRAGTVFNPTGIVGIADSNPDGGLLPNIGGSGGGTGSRGGMGLGGALVGAAAAGSLSCGAAALLYATEATSGAAAGAAAGVVATAAGVAANAPLIPVAVQTIHVGSVVVQGAGATAIAGTVGLLGGGQVADFSTNTFLSCIARTVAKIALDQITNSVVNWINSGFSGSPSFVTNPERFFTNVADNAAGEFIKGSALSFLCSPFQLKIRVAIARSYANRYNAPSCSLTGVVRNIHNFMNGNFYSGGWPGFLAFTTMPTNNPYGALMYADLAVQYTVQTRVGAQQRELSLANGFLDFKQKTKCQAVVNPSTVPQSTANTSVRQVGTGGAVAANQQGPALGSNIYEVCELTHTTPGAVIGESLNGTFKSTYDSLNMADNFDEIISALITQLVTRTLQGGLLNLSGQDGYASNFYTPEQQQAQSATQSLLVQMRGETNLARSYASIKQGAISDIQTTQTQLYSLFECWSDVSPTINPAAVQSATSASSTVQTLELQVAAHNNQITRTNNAIATLEQLQSRALSAGSQADIDSVLADYRAAQAQGEFFSQNDITTAQQDRGTLQNQLDNLDQQTSLSLNQCNATIH